MQTAIRILLLCASAALASCSRKTARLVFEPELPKETYVYARAANTSDACGYDHVTPRALIAFPDNPIRRKGKGVFDIRISPEYELKPVVTTLMIPSKGEGSSDIQGPGVKSHSKVGKNDLVDIVCGNWAYKEKGVYSYAVTTQNSSLFIQYYVRPRSEALDIWAKKIPITLVYEITHEDIDSSKIDVLAGVVRKAGKITVILKYTIAGNGL